MFVREMKETDAESVLAIYQEGIDTGHATFASAAPTWDEFVGSKVAGSMYVAQDEDGSILGWAAVSRVSSRCVYAGVAEVSVYVAGAARRRGVGRALLGALVEGSERAGTWTLQAGIFPENRGSIALHEALGFRRVGVRRRLGKMSHGPREGTWRDVVFMERRSEVVGVE